MNLGTENFYEERTFREYLEGKKHGKSTFFSCQQIDKGTCNNSIWRHDKFVETQKITDTYRAYYFEGKALNAFQGGFKDNIEDIRGGFGQNTKDKKTWRGIQYFDGF